MTGKKKEEVKRCGYPHLVEMPKRHRVANYKCLRDAQPGAKFCIFHSDNIKGRKDEFEAAFTRELKEQKEKDGPYDFTGFVFPDDYSFEGKKFEKKVVFLKAKLISGRFYGVDLMEYIFTEADLRGANFQEANLCNADFREAFLQKTKLMNTNFNGADFRGSYLWEIDLRGAKLWSADFREAQFIEAKLMEVDFNGADFHKTNFQGAYLEKAYLTGADFTEANFNGAKLIEANLMCTKLVETNLTKTELNKANLWNAKLHKANLEEANLEEANLWNADFTKADLTKANLRKANLWGADLRGANLRGANFEECSINDIKYDRSSCYMGIRLSNCYGSPLFVRFAKDQEYLEDFKVEYPKTYTAWLILADCGRSYWRWALWCLVGALLFAFIYTPPCSDIFPDWWIKICNECGPQFEHTSKAFSNQPTDFWSSWYFSIVTFTTLGFGDIVAANITARILVTIEVIAGYIMLGGLISIFANKLARRS